jgi:hypothetical protein
MRTTHFEMDFKILIKKLGDREKIVPVDGENSST